MRHQRIPAVTPWRRGVSLLELVVASGSATFLLMGLGASVLLTTKSFRPETTAQYARTSAADVQRNLLNDLQLAIRFTERTDKAVTFQVPDRDGNGQPEILRYAWSGITGEPLTFSINGATPAPLLNDVRSLSLKYLTQSIAATPLPAESSGSQIMLLVNDSSNPTAAELAWQDRLQSWNFVVVLIGSNDTKTAFFSAAASSQAVLVPGDFSASSFGYAAELAGLSIGIANANTDLVDDIGFAKATTTALSSMISVVTSGHHITQDVSSGNNAVTTFPTSMAKLSETPSPGLNALGTASSTVALATINPKKLLYDGRTAAGRRVMIPWGTSMSPSQLSTTGQKLTARAIEWAAGMGDALDLEKPTLGYSTAYSTALSDVRRIQIGVWANLNQQATVVSLSVLLSDSKNPVRVAIYSDNAGQPGTLLTQSNNFTPKDNKVWNTISVPQVTLQPGAYWLALSLDNDGHTIYTDSTVTGVQWTTSSNNAIDNGFSQAWGTAEKMNLGAISIYANFSDTP